MSSNFSNLPARKPVSSLNSFCTGCPPYLCGTQCYDLVIEDADGKFWRIQCKSAWIDENGTVLKFDTANHNVTGTKRDWRHYRGQCEYFAVYSAELNKVYLVPVDDVGTTRAHLRLEPSKNKQEKNVRWARDYEL